MNTACKAQPWPLCVKRYADRQVAKQAQLYWQPFLKTRWSTSHNIGSPSITPEMVVNAAWNLNMCWHMICDTTWSCKINTKHQVCRSNTLIDWIIMVTSVVYAFNSTDAFMTAKYFIGMPYDASALFLLYAMSALACVERYAAIAPKDNWYLAWWEPYKVSWLAVLLWVRSAICLHLIFAWSQVLGECARQQDCNKPVVMTYPEWLLKSSSNILPSLATIHTPCYTCTSSCTKLNGHLSCLQLSPYCLHPVPMPLLTQHSSSHSWQWGDAVGECAHQPLQCHMMNRLITNGDHVSLDGLTKSSTLVQWYRSGVATTDACMVQAAQYLSSGQNLMCLLCHQSFSNDHCHRWHNNPCDHTSS